MNSRPAAFAEIAALNKTEYHQHYLKGMASPEWKRLRRAVISRDKGLCRFCLMRPAVEVHHTTYRFGIFAPAVYLVAVCIECHNKWHRGWHGLYSHLPANDNSAPLMVFAEASGDK